MPDWMRTENHPMVPGRPGEIATFLPGILIARFVDFSGQRVVVCKALWAGREPMSIPDLESGIAILSDALGYLKGAL